MTARDKSRSAPKSREVEPSELVSQAITHLTMYGRASVEAVGALFEERTELLNVRDAARAFLDTMPLRHSHVAGREVPSGFTMESQPAAVALFDALAAMSPVKP